VADIWRVGLFGSAALIRC